ncbi:MAG: hypothetical protein M1482_17120 [Chloroflexi bacterium]|nr:hypothetical protein [Chloroflexota bacterium]
MLTLPARLGTSKGQPIGNPRQTGTAGREKCRGASHADRRHEPGVGHPKHVRAIELVHLDGISTALSHTAAAAIALVIVEYNPAAQPLL